MPPTQTPAPSRRLLSAAQSQASHSGRRNAPFSRSGLPSSSASPFPASQRFSKPNAEARDEIDASFDNGSSPTLPTRNAPVRPVSKPGYVDIEDEKNDELDLDFNLPQAPESAITQGNSYVRATSPERKRRKLSKFVPDGIDILDTPSSPSSDEREVDQEELTADATAQHTSSPSPTSALPHITKDDDNSDNSSSSSIHSLSTTPTKSTVPHTQGQHSNRFRLSSHTQPSSTSITAPHTHPSSNTLQPPQQHSRSNFLLPNHSSALHNNSPQQLLPDAFTPSRRRQKQRQREYIPNGAADMVRRWVLELANREREAVGIGSTRIDKWTAVGRGVGRSTMSSTNANVNAMMKAEDVDMPDIDAESDAGADTDPAHSDEANGRRGAHATHTDPHMLIVEEARHEMNGRFTLVQSANRGKWMLVGEQPTQSLRNGGTVVLKGTASRWDVDLDMPQPDSSASHRSRSNVWNVAALWDVR